MTFWRESLWQNTAANAVRTALSDVHARLSGRDLGNGAWTSEVMTAVGALSATHCPRGICAHKGSAATEWYTGGEWMFDLVWLVQEVPRSDEFARTIGVPLVLESEWHGWHNVWDDFDKLLLARAGLRVFIFERDRATPDDWAEILLARAATFADASPDDAWLLCAWSSNGFSCHTRIRPIT